MLTEEQKRKIEENKRKALEKLKKANDDNNVRNFESTQFKSDRLLINNSNTSTITSPQKTGNQMIRSTSYSPLKKNQVDKTFTSMQPKTGQTVASAANKSTITSPQRTGNQMVRNTSYSPFKKKQLCEQFTSIQPKTDQLVASAASQSISTSPVSKNRTASYSPFSRRLVEEKRADDFNLMVGDSPINGKISTKANSHTSFSPAFKSKTSFVHDNVEAPKAKHSLLPKMKENDIQPKIKVTTSYSPCFRKKTVVGAYSSTTSTTTTIERKKVEERTPTVKRTLGAQFEEHAMKTIKHTTSYSSVICKKRPIDNACTSKLDGIGEPEPKRMLSEVDGQKPCSSHMNNDQAVRAEMNRLKALEKLKNRNKQQVKTLSVDTNTQSTLIDSQSSQSQLFPSQESENIEVRFSVSSPTWFRLECPSNNAISTVVNKIKNRNYDKGSWLFHIKDYKNVVTQFSNIANIKIKETIPTSTVKILQVAHEEQNRKPLEKIDISRIDKNIIDKLMPFQKTGVKFAVQKKGRVLIADDMGLGKTIQAIAICNYYVEDWPVLVICPSSVKMSWQQHFLTWIPTLREDDVAVIHTGKERLMSTSVTIISCDLASKLTEQIQTHGFQIIVVDESHCLKNNQAKRTKNLIPILQDSKRTILLSGTPAVSRPKELFTQISALRRDLFKSYFKFAKRYCDAKEGRFGLEDDGCSNSDELNAVLKSTVMLRRMKYEVLDQLPSKMRQIVIIDPSLVKITKELKDNEKAFLKKKKDDRGPLLQYYANSSQAKVKGVLQFILEKLDSTNEKMIVFAHHLNILDKIEEATRNKNIESIRISGNTSSKARQALVDVFNNNASCKLAILSLTAAGTGLNMTSSSLVIFAELYWNPGHLIQAEDRVHRIGQKNSVSIIYLVAQQTADDYIWPLVKNKLNILTNLGVGTKQGLHNTKYTETKHATQTKISDFCNRVTVKDEDLDELFANLQDDDWLDDEKLLEVSQKGC